jgi:hypothetical protein
MRSTCLFALALSSAALLAVACGGSEPPAKPPVTDTSSSGGTSTAPPSSSGDAGASPAAAAVVDAGAPSVPTTKAPSFDDLPKDKKVEVMMTKVVPNVGKHFKDLNAKKYDKFGCATCHGASKKEDPHKVLPKLTLSGGGYEKLSKTKPDIMKMMGEKVVPTMAEALGEKPYDPATKQGFGCTGCHTVD